MEDEIRTETEFAGKENAEVQYENPGFLAEPASEESPEPMSEEISEPAPEKSPEPMSGEISEPAPEESPEPMSGEISEPAPEESPEPMSGEISEPAPEEPPEPMSGEISEPAPEEPPEPAPEKQGKTASDKALKISKDAPKKTRKPRQLMPKWLQSFLISLVCGAIAGAGVGIAVWSKYPNFSLLEYLFDLLDVMSIIPECIIAGTLASVIIWLAVIIGKGRSKRKEGYRKLLTLLIPMVTTVGVGAILYGVVHNTNANSPVFAHLGLDFSVSLILEYLILAYIVGCALGDILVLLVCGNIYREGVSWILGVFSLLRLIGGSWDEEMAKDTGQYSSRESYNTHVFIQLITKIIGIVAVVILSGLTVIAVSIAYPIRMFVNLCVGIFAKD